MCVCVCLEGESIVLKKLLSDFCIDLAFFSLIVTKTFVTGGENSLNFAPRPLNSETFSVFFHRSSI